MTTKNPSSERPRYGRRSIRLAIWMASGAVACLTVVGGLAAAALGSLGRIPDGSGTATITWTGKSGLHPTISDVAGTVGHYRVKGSGTLPNYFQHQGLTSTPTGVTATLATIHGTLAGTPFTITISLSTGGSTGPSHSFATVSGSFHGLPVSATIEAPNTQKELLKDLGTFKGTIGAQHVQGTIAKPKTSHGHNMAHATFVVSG